MQYAYVLNKRGEPLMPCSPGKARILLKQQKACVVKRTPFTIKLLHGSAGYKQPITLGVDAGSKHVGLSASTEKRELYSEEFTPRNDAMIDDAPEKHKSKGWTNAMPKNKRS